jgi:hypothetical protein
MDKTITILARRTADEVVLIIDQHCARTVTIPTNSPPLELRSVPQEPTQILLKH